MASLRRPSFTTSRNVEPQKLVMTIMGEDEGHIRYVYVTVPPQETLQGLREVIADQLEDHQVPSSYFFQYYEKDVDTYVNISRKQEEQPALGLPKLRIHPDSNKKKTKKRARDDDEEAVPVRTVMADRAQSAAETMDVSTSEAGESGGEIPPTKPKQEGSNQESTSNPVHLNPPPVDALETEPLVETVPSNTSPNGSNLVCNPPLAHNTANNEVIELLDDSESEGDPQQSDVRVARARIPYSPAEAVPCSHHTGNKKPATSKGKPTLPKANNTSGAKAGESSTTNKNPNPLLGQVQTESEDEDTDESTEDLWTSFDSNWRNPKRGPNSITPPKQPTAAPEGQASEENRRAKTDQIWFTMESGCNRVFSVQPRDPTQIIESTHYLYGARRLPNNFQLGPYDVICARGNQALENEGNVRYRALVKQHEGKYAQCTCKDEKSKIVSYIINSIRQACAYHEGGFVKNVDGLWYEVGDRAARQKVGQAFRDLLHNKYSSSTKAKAKTRIQK